jgi:hypothetical protein
MSRCAACGVRCNWDCFGTGAHECLHDAVLRWQTELSVETRDPVPQRDSTLQTYWCRFAAARAHCFMRGNSARRDSGGTLPRTEVRDRVRTCMYVCIIDKKSLDFARLTSAGSTALNSEPPLGGPYIKTWYDRTFRGRVQHLRPLVDAVLCRVSRAASRTSAAVVRRQAPRRQITFDIRTRWLSSGALRTCDAHSQSLSLSRCSLSLDARPLARAGLHPLEVGLRRL